MKRLFVAAILVLAAVAVSSAYGGKPVTERVNVDDTFADDFLTAECGVPVTTHAEGHMIIHTFSGGGTGPAAVRTLSIALTATAGGNSYRFRDVGADHTQVKKDGTEILMIIGQVPFDFIGVLKINLTTGEVIHEPGHSIGGRIEEACAALTA